MSAGRLIALLIGLTILAIGLNGIRVGKVLVRSVRPPWPGYFLREKEPIAFWVTVCLWIALGTFVVAASILQKAFV
jgi:hypothetical protein